MLMREAPPDPLPDLLGAIELAVFQLQTDGDGQRARACALAILNEAVRVAEGGPVILQ